MWTRLPTSAAIQPATRVSSSRRDVWSIVNEAAAASSHQPVINLGQGSFGWNPPEFVLDAAKEALNRIDCNQYSPSRGRLRLREAIAKSYSPFFGHNLDPETEIVVTTGANEGMLSAFMAFIEPGDEVIVFEPFFDQYISNIEMAGGIVKYVPLEPPTDTKQATSSAANWKLNVAELKIAIGPRTRMMVINTPHNPIGKVFSKSELEIIATICVQHNIIVLSDEVYDRLHYVPFTRISTLSPEISRLTLTVGSAGKNFFVTGWRVGYLMGPESLIKHVATAHTRICFSSVSPLQEAVAVAFEEADSFSFWETSKGMIKKKMDKFNQIWDELGLPYTKPDGGYFVLVNLNKVNLPEDYPFPSHIAERPRDFQLSYFLINELGVVAVPPTEFYTQENAHYVQNYLRFSVCQSDELLDEAHQRLRGLRKYICS